MFRHLAVAASGLALLFAVPAPAADKSPAADQKAADAQKPKERKYCERVIETGSIRPKLICRTAAEKRAQETQAESSLEDMRRGVSAGGGALGNR